MTFREAYDLTGRILNITVMSDEKHSRFKVLNYINSPHVTIRSAVVASSSVPGVIPPGTLYMKDSKGNITPYLGAGLLWRDGSMISDIPEREIQQQFRVKHTIVSQVNPHISMFFYRPKGTAGAPSMNRSGKGWYFDC
jgi:predicted acylesterase/phospholipase RssA